MGRQRIGRKGRGLEENFPLIVAFDGGLFHPGCCSKWRLGNRPSSEAGQPRSQSGDAGLATSLSLQSDGNPPVLPPPLPVEMVMATPLVQKERPKRGKSKNGLG